jgi:acyl-coenzyme A synthetase/AMP-(fatty) acid ligase
VRYYRTGDLAWQDADGDCFFVGRVDQQVKLQGYRVELAEIEHHVRALVPGHSCVVLPLTAANGVTELHLVVEGYRGDLKAVLHALRDRLPSYMVPGHAVALPQLPLNSSGKIDRRKLRVDLGAGDG